MYVGLTIVFLLHVANSFNFMTERVAYLVSIGVLKGFLENLWQNSRQLRIFMKTISWWSINFTKTVGNFPVNSFLMLILEQIYNIWKK